MLLLSTHETRVPWNSLWATESPNSHATWFMEIVMIFTPLFLFIPASACVHPIPLGSLMVGGSSFKVYSNATLWDAFFNFSRLIFKVLLGVLCTAAVGLSLSRTLFKEPC
jgi:hypothetical protein